MDAQKTHFGERRVRLDAKQGLVDGVFHSVADRYDLMNDLMSGGLHRLWKDRLVAMAAPPRHRAYHHLDFAGGTGDVAFRIARAGGELTRVTVADINPDMLRVGEKRARKRREFERLEFVEANAEAPPFAAGAFDGYTIAFGIRNVPRIARALEEAHRVLKRGGRFLCLEFSKVDAPGLDRLYAAYSDAVIPALGKVVTGDGAI
jgi:demethylmenaquinone methyltransferase/2-methoxy-6-polyprenyl-1,4-benzoquinol methylase